MKMFNMTNILRSTSFVLIVLAPAYSGPTYVPNNCAGKILIAANGSVQVQSLEQKLADDFCLMLDGSGIDGGCNAYSPTCGRNPNSHLQSLANTIKEPLLKWGGMIESGCSASGWWTGDDVLSDPSRYIAMMPEGGIRTIKGPVYPNILGNLDAPESAWKNGIAKVPAAVITGEHDGLGCQGQEFQTFCNARAHNAPWCFVIVKGGAHCDAASKKAPFLDAYLRAIIPLRTKSASKTPSSKIVFDTLDLRTGWLGEMYTIPYGKCGDGHDGATGTGIDAPMVRVASAKIWPYDEFPGNKITASWFPNKAVAEEWVKLLIDSTKSPTTLTVTAPAVFSKYTLNKIGDSISISIKINAVGGFTKQVVANIVGKNAPVFAPDSVPPYEFTWKVKAFASANAGGKEHYNIFASSIGSDCDGYGCPIIYSNSPWVPIDISMPMGNTATIRHSLKPKNNWINKSKNHNGLFDLKGKKLTKSSAPYK